MNVAGTVFLRHKDIPFSFYSVSGWGCGQLVGSTVRGCFFYFPVDKANFHIGFILLFFIASILDKICASRLSSAIAFMSLGCMAVL